MKLCLQWYKENPVKNIYFESTLRSVMGIKEHTQRMEIKQHKQQNAECYRKYCTLLYRENLISQN